MTIPRLPQGWTAIGGLPGIDADSASEERLELLDEDLLQITDPTQTFILDAGWYPSFRRDGKFICRVIVSDNWDAPEEKFETRNRERVMTWFESWVSGIQDRLGERARISNERVVDEPVQVVARPLNVVQAPSVVEREPEVSKVSVPIRSATNTELEAVV